MPDKLITDLTAYTPPIDTDVLPIVDVTTNSTKKITWTSIKAALKTYFDSLYPSGSGTSTGSNTGDQTLPVKASGAEVDTGTDDAKFVTAKAVADSKLSYTDGTETLTNKTLTSPKLNENVVVTATATEVNLIDGSVAGTAVASKALVLGADKNVDTLSIADNGLKLGAGEGTAVTSTAAELNALDGKMGEWTTSTPTITASSGTFTSVSCAMRHMQIGKIVFIQFSITITTNGTAAGSTIVPLPVNCRAVSVLAGRETASVGKMLQGYVGSTSISIFDTANTYVGGNGYILVMSGSYEAA